MANTSVIQMLGNSACFSLSSEDSVSQPMVQLSWWGLSGSISPGKLVLEQLLQLFCHSSSLKIALASP